MTTTLSALTGMMLLLTPTWDGGERILTPDDALRLGLSSSPIIAQADATTRGLRGFWRERRGTFDGRFDLDFSFDYARLELTPTVYNALVEQREGLEDLVAELESLADDLETQLAESDSRVIAECSEDLLIFINDQPICNSIDNQNAQAFDDVLLELLGVELGLSDDFLGDLSDTSNDSLVAAREATEETIVSLRASAADTQESRDLLGDAPIHDETISLNLDLSWTKQFRNGMSLVPLLTLSGVETNYSGKEKSTTLGGKGIQNTFSTQFSLTWNVPLREGRGRRVATATERAAELDYRAAEANARRTTAEQAATVLSAYWDLLAAQERLELRRSAARLQERLSEISEALIEADQAPRGDLRRSAASLAGARSAAASARRALTSARVALADALGVEAGAFDVRAEASWPESPDLARIAATSLESLIDESLERRSDLAAARFQEQAEALRRDAAADVLRRAVDLEFTVGYLGLEEESSISDGFYGALTRDVPGVSAVFNLSMEWPRSTRADEGEWLQASAAYDRQRIVAQEAERAAASSIVSLVGSLQDVARQVRRKEEAVELNAEVRQAQIDLFQAGEATLLDTLLAEDRLTSARLALLAARRAYAENLTQLRLETETLLFWTADRPQFDILQIVQAPFRSPRHVQTATKPLSPSRAGETLLARATRSPHARDHALRLAGLDGPRLRLGGGRGVGRLR